MGRKLILALDQGTSSSRSVVFDESGAVLGSAQREFRQVFPRSGWVEHDAAEIWAAQRDTVHEALTRAEAQAAEVVAIGITNQRETIALWDRATGVPLANAIVWQDRRTAARLSELAARRGLSEQVAERTGLVLDPYFSASKLAWLLDTIPGARARAARGELAAGTMDSWLVWNLTGGAAHITDISNASRTMLMDLRTGEWCPEMLALFDIPQAVLPKIVPSCGVVAQAVKSAIGCEAPICGIAGDQQAALFGQGCHAAGQAKCTFGTGCFLLLNTGEQLPRSSNRLLSTTAWRLGQQPITYALEGSVFVGGSAIQWLRDGLKLIAKASDVNALAASVTDTGGVEVVPAFAGLGAPWWDAEARGTIVGLTRGSTGAHIARATLEAIALQVADLVEAMRADAHAQLASLQVDGGACASDLLMQTQADVLGIPVERPRNLEVTALGAAMLAGQGAGIWSGPGQLAQFRQINRVFQPARNADWRAARRQSWHRAVERSRGWAASERGQT